MKVIIEKGILRIEDTHDLLRRSLLHLIARKKPSIFTYQDAPLSESEFEATMHLTFDSNRFSIKQARSFIRPIKKEWSETKLYIGAAFTPSELYKRGWSEDAIKSFLGKCDGQMINPHSNTGAPMKLFHVKRVINAESEPQWQEWLASH